MEYGEVPENATQSLPVVQAAAEDGSASFGERDQIEPFSPNTMQKMKSAELLQQHRKSCEEKLKLLKAKAASIHEQRRRRLSEWGDGASSRRSEGADFLSSTERGEEGETKGISEEQEKGRQKKDRVPLPASSVPSGLDDFLTGLQQSEQQDVQPAQPKTGAEGEEKEEEETFGVTEEAAAQADLLNLEDHDEEEAGGMEEQQVPPTPPFSSSKADAAPAAVSDPPPRALESLSRGTEGSAEKQYKSRVCPGCEPPPVPVGGKGGGAKGKAGVAGKGSKVPTNSLLADLEAIEADEQKILCLSVHDRLYLEKRLKELRKKREEEEKEGETEGERELRKQRERQRETARMKEAVKTASEVTERLLKYRGERAERLEELRRQLEEEEAARLKEQQVGAHLKDGADPSVVERLYGEAEKRRIILARLMDAKKAELFSNPSGRSTPHPPHRTPAHSRPLSGCTRNPTGRHGQSSSSEGPCSVNRYARVPSGHQGANSGTAIRYLSGTTERSPPVHGGCRGSLGVALSPPRPVHSNDVMNSGGSVCLDDRGERGAVLRPTGIGGKGENQKDRERERAQAQDSAALVNDLRVKIRSLTSDCERARASAARLEAEVSELKASKDDIHSLLLKERETSKKLRLQLKTLKAFATSREEEFHELRARRRSDAETISRLKEVVELYKEKSLRVDAAVQSLMIRLPDQFRGELMPLPPACKSASAGEQASAGAKQSRKEGGVPKPPFAKLTETPKRPPSRYSLLTPSKTRPSRSTSPPTDLHPPLPPPLRPPPSPSARLFAPPSRHKERQAASPRPSPERTAPPSQLSPPSKAAPNAPSTPSRLTDPKQSTFRSLRISSSTSTDHHKDENVALSPKGHHQPRPSSGPGRQIPSSTPASPNFRNLSPTTQAPDAGMALKKRKGRWDYVQPRYLTPKKEPSQDAPPSSGTKSVGPERRRVVSSTPRRPPSACERRANRKKDPLDLSTALQEKPTDTEALVSKKQPVSKPQPPPSKKTTTNKSLNQKEEAQANPQSPTVNEPTPLPTHPVSPPPSIVKNTQVDPGRLSTSLLRSSTPLSPRSQAVEKRINEKIERALMARSPSGSSSPSKSHSHSFGFSRGPSASTAPAQPQPPLPSTSPLDGLPTEKEQEGKQRPSVSMSERVKAEADRSVPDVFAEQSAVSAVVPVPAQSEAVGAAPKKGTGEVQSTAEGAMKDHTHTAAPSPVPPPSISLSNEKGDPTGLPSLLDRAEEEERPREAAHGGDPSPKSASVRTPGGRLRSHRSQHGGTASPSASPQGDGAEIDEEIEMY
uniref:Lebercilin domain-containing protein n=1 Tax=Chromera velia CCMP2878 TaxID=1169474 RepID=A0A0G4FCX6_9ALVE|eukprot:Cvel_16413.t1-p1 / transcript=Cvel_16413.t1 / gene=Cvel_16413 / organism=Chromera_velia_CCMP2878 / gene_product=hypothetical protein / transcript_product=hypothetical protein / location=Cvel_scaffold1263:36632-44766(-) / protein_length=1294 / sequence_SO=supercontig / SO=protein_coding / is_pseudo=false